MPAPDAAARREVTESLLTRIRAMPEGESVGFILDADIEGSLIDAASALGVIGPMPGMVSGRRLTLLDQYQA